MVVILKGKEKMTGKLFRIFAEYNSASHLTRESKENPFSRSKDKKNNKNNKVKRSSGKENVEKTWPSKALKK